MLNFIFVIITTNLLISAFYIYFKNSWPEEYFGPDNKFSLAISVSLNRLLTFRIAPTLVICLIVFSYANFEIGIIPWTILGMIVTLSYALITSGVSLIKIIMHSKSVKVFLNKPTQIMYHISSFIFLIAIGGASGFIASFNLVNKLDNNIRSLFDNIVAAMLYSVILIPIYIKYKAFVSESNQNINKIISKSLSEIMDNKELFKKIRETAKSNNANFNLVLAFCIVENIQRPKWFRKLENLFFLSKATKGIMQVKSRGIVSDSKSVEIAIEKFFRNTGSYDINKETLIKIIVKYNGTENEKYIKFIEQAIYNIDEEWYKKITKNSL